MSHESRIQLEETRPDARRSNPPQLLIVLVDVNDAPVVEPGNTTPRRRGGRIPNDDRPATRKRELLHAAILDERNGASVRRKREAAHSHRGVERPGIKAITRLDPQLRRRALC